MSGVQSSTVSESVHSCCCACPEAPSVGRDAEGNVQFENENYTIGVSDNGEINVANKNTGENYRVWGDPHVEVDGKQAFDFYGRTTFTLDDGTKITVQTTPWAGGSGDQTVASKVTISDGDFGVHITGVDPNQRGDLSFVEVDGELADAVIRDGNNLYENPFGSGFLGVDQNGQISNVDQAFINGTDEQLNAEEFVQPFANMFQQLAGLYSIGFVGGFLSGYAAGQESNNDLGVQAANFLLTLIRST